MIQSNVIVVKSENENPGNIGNTADPEFVNPFGFEQTMKKIKLEDQSSEIERLNEIIKNLKEENIMLNKKVSEFTDLREEFLKLQIDVNDLEVKVQQKNQKIKNLKEKIRKIRKEISAMIEEIWKLVKENALSKYGEN